jgi:hypothetical protein
LYPYIQFVDVKSLPGHSQGALMVTAGSSGSKVATTSTPDVDDEEYFEPSKKETDGNANCRERHRYILRNFIF